MLLNINGNDIKVKVVFSEKDIQNGMMYKDFDSTFKGMLFMMKEGEHCFWMKNCIIPLDIIFIQDDEIVKIYHNCPPCVTEECENYCSKANYVLELKGGSCKNMDINEGDFIGY